MTQDKLSPKYSGRFISKPINSFGGQLPILQLDLILGAVK